MIFKRIILFLVLSLLICETSFLCEGYEDLRNIGSKFHVLIENPFERLVEINLTEKRLRTVTELRLRKEGMIIIPDDVKANYKIPSVYIIVSMIGSAYHIDLEIHEWVDLERIPITHGTIATIWNISAIGIHGGDPEQIVSSLNKLLDVFFIYYYKANPKENQRGEKEEGERVEERRDFQFSATTFLRR